MTLINHYTSNQLTEIISDAFGEDLECLNLDEMLNVLWDIIANIGDAEEEISQDATDAAMAVRQTIEQPTNAINLILGLTDLLDKRVNKFLSDYTESWWVEPAADAFGNSLDRLTANEHSWILYCLLQRAVDTDCFEHIAEMELIGDWLEINTDENIDQFELIKVARAVALMAVERYFASDDAA